MLHAAKVRTGRFTSPHLIDRWDCITIDEHVIDENKFHQKEKVIKDRNLDWNVKASEFEILTATAFELFGQEKVEVGVVEVGMGGQQDATNIVRNPLATVITKIGKDHQSLLGNTIEEIATHKAGIMKRGVPCIVDATNDPNVLRIFEAIAQRAGSHPLVHVSDDLGPESATLLPVFIEHELERHQRINLSLAYLASKFVLQQRSSMTHLPALLDAARKTVWPGRLQFLSITVLTGRQKPVLLDGAHNAQSARVLGSFVNKRIRKRGHPVTWVVAISVGKGLQELLSPLCQPQDNIVAVKYGTVEGMPWVSPTDPHTILETATSLGLSGSIHDAGRDILGALKFATRIAATDPVVICGSLYLVADVLRLARDIENHKIRV
ncbi:MAG: hypothetical protein Q9219_005803 [cf. Caloplaca sp. 3 TL-2023]